MGVLRAPEASREGDGVLGKGRLQHQRSLSMLRHPVKNPAEEPRRGDRRIGSETKVFGVRCSQVNPLVLLSFACLCPGAGIPDALTEFPNFNFEPSLFDHALAHTSLIAIHCWRSAASQNTGFPITRPATLPSRYFDFCCTDFPPPPFSPCKN